MNSTPPDPTSEPAHRRFWLILALVLMLIGWWVYATQRQAPEVPGAAATAPLPAGSEVAVFAGGCFWCTEADFDKVPGVLATTSGYTGGKTANPSYAEVSSHTTGHAEALQVIFDPSQVSYRQLVDYFWRTIDPTVKDRQFCDIGSPYRTAIFATSPEQLQVALASRAALETTKPFPEPLVTQLLMADDFYPAEAEHQNYHQNNPVRYDFYRKGCGRDARLAQLWGDQAKARP
ncbi:peptide-methionine (S)-S-oxide reductase MsrA [Rhodoferax sp.]|uniref:peptide-methionine (S)-S-oxide reductase MsrA n=1 Tax=Rhodoferax sp. TaxID=50421 RepID=UPI00260E1A32|nr:peptide-methionine (S)-S-oxide reductase MsrA [Rhodoferax sp.]MDD2918243.1 peptide-methionine (S)-S-oxide reductase MsrA [Rhodoferax sp.]